MLILFGAFLVSLSQIFAENITISCHISDDISDTHPNLHATSHGNVWLNPDTKRLLINCSNYLSYCYINNSTLEKSHSKIGCITNVGYYVNCTYTDLWLRDTHCGPEFNDSSCEMMTISCPKEEVVMTTAKGEDLILLLSTRKAIYQYDLSANRKMELIGNQNDIFGYAMDYWLKDSTIIWSASTYGTEKIYMCNLTTNLQFPKMIACDDNSNHAVLVEHNVSNPYGLAVDWIHGLLFWVDSGLKTINVMDLNTKQRKVLFKDVDRPLAIAVDPSKGLIFWIGAIESNDLLGRRDRIERASMDGNDRMTIATFEDDFRVTSIALDIFNERVYWADYYTKTENDTKAIASVDYNGNDWRTILHSDTLIDPIYSLTIFEEKLYWTDRYRDGVYVINKFNGTEVRKLISGVEHPRTVRVYHSAVQPELPNKCDQHSCGDGAICLPKGNSSMGLSYSCVCADRYKRGEESNTCVLGI